MNIQDEFNIRHDCISAIKLMVIGEDGRVYLKDKSQVKGSDGTPIEMLYFSGWLYYLSDGASDHVSALTTEELFTLRKELYNTISK